MQTNAPVLPKEDYLVEVFGMEDPADYLGEFINNGDKFGITTMEKDNFYRRYTVDLSSKAGQTVHFGFYLYVDDAAIGRVGMLEHPGAYIDNVKLIKGSPQ